MAILQLRLAGLISPVMMMASVKLHPQELFSEQNLVMAAKFIRFSMGSITERTRQHDRHLKWFLPRELDGIVGRSGILELDSHAEGLTSAV